MSPRKSLSETSLSARRKRAVFKAFALSLLILFLVSLLDRPEGYVERFIPYAFVQSPSRVYRHDEIDEGKDYNVISVYAVSADADGEGFLRFLNRSADWNPLPLTPDIWIQPLLAERFDTHIDDMLLALGRKVSRPDGIRCADLSSLYPQVQFFVNTSVYSKFCHDSVCRSKTCSMPPSSSRA